MNSIILKEARRAKIKLKIDLQLPSSFNNTNI
jgi:hypothetical protein